MEQDIIHDEAQQKFIYKIDPQHNAFIFYRIRDGKYYLDHSEVPQSLRGKGYGKILADKTFEYLIEKNINAIATCSYLRAVAQRNFKWKNFV